MKIIKDAIIYYPSRGDENLQIPDSYIGEEGSEELEEVPDDWLCFLKDNRPAVGKEEGFLYLTKKGFEENKEKIKDVFEKYLAVANVKGWSDDRTWKDFEKSAEKHFKEVEKATKKFQKDLENKLKQIKDFII